MKEISSKRWMSAWLAIFALTLGVSAGFAQVDTGTILGTVKDQSGAVVPGAKVTIVNQGTADSITTLTRSDGTYIVTPLKIGSYRISVELAGFKKRMPRSTSISNNRLWWISCCRLERPTKPCR